MSQTEQVRRKGAWRTRLTRRLSIVAWLITVAISVGSTTSALAAPAMPFTTTSRYLTTVDNRVNTGALFNEGCSMGTAAQSGLVVLLFGAAGWTGTSTYGAWNWKKGFYTIAQIREAGKAFLTGYWDCSPYYPTVTLALGVSNDGNGDSYGHGAAWASMINDISAWIGAVGYGKQETIAGAMDFEPGFGSASLARSWVAGYSSTYRYAFYNVGSADGCPTTGQVNGANHGCYNGWTQDDIYYVSWGASTAWAVPEIYRTDGVQAAQWEQISLYGQYHYSSSLKFSGVLTQQGACQSSGCKPTVANSPATGWNQLWNATAASVYTSSQPFLKWSTDITWVN